MAQEKIELTDKSDDILREELTSLEAEYQQMKFDHAVSGLGNPMEIRAMRRNIARFHTEIRNRELATMSVEALGMRTKLKARRRRQK